MEWFLANSGRVFELAAEAADDVAVGLAQPVRDPVVPVR